MSIVRALAISARQNWIDDETALSIALKFAGENYTIEEIRDILATARSEDGDDDADVDVDGIPAPLTTNNRSPTSRSLPSDLA